MAGNRWHAAVTPCFKILDCVATLHYYEKLLVTQVIENPQLLWIADRDRHPTKHWFLPETHKIPVHIFTTCSFQIYINGIFLSICLFLCLWVTFSFHRFRLRFSCFLFPPFMLNILPGQLSVIWWPKWHFVNSDYSEVGRYLVFSSLLLISTVGNTLHQSVQYWSILSTQRRVANIFYILLTVHLELYLYNNQHSARIQNLSCDFALNVSGLHTAHHQEVMCTIWQMVIACLLDVDCLWANRQSTFKETSAICRIVHVASWWWAVWGPETCKAKSQNKLLN
jgi:hypothetical protein